MVKTYQEGLHILATLKEVSLEKLLSFEACKVLVQQLIKTHNLLELGAVYHNFDVGGYTAVICLSESHISIHTWPEHGLLNLDIYLSNFSRVNDGVVESLFTEFESFFQGKVESLIRLKR